jgi:transcription-repair coupling factor (superfamily II helicase)
MTTRKPGFLAPLLPNAKHSRVRWGQLYGSADSLALANAAATLDAPLIVVTSGAREADRLQAEIGFYLSGHDVPVLSFPDWETLAYDVFSPHQDIVSERLATLYTLPTLARSIVVLPAQALMQRLAPRAYVESAAFILATGERLDLDAMRRRLDNAGYRNVSQVVEHGEFAVRGSLLDLFPMGAALPYRIDLFDDEIESIRQFDPDSQRSQDKLERVRLLPAREFPLTEEAIRGFRQRYRRRFEGDPQRSLIYRDVSNGIAPGGIEYYLPLFFAETASLLDYLPADAVVASTDETDGALDAGWRQIQERYEQRGHNIERPLMKPEEAFFDPSSIDERIGAFRNISVQRFELEPAAEAKLYNSASARPPELIIDQRGDNPVHALLTFLEHFDGRVLFAAESAGRREHLLDLLHARDILPARTAGWREFLDSDARIGICVAPLQQGLYLPHSGLAVIAEEQLFGPQTRQQRRRRTTAKDPEAIIRDLTDLTEGAPVIHETHGVGRYLGLNTLTVDSVDTEFLTLEYAGGDKLYVPVAALDLVSRYTGGAPEHAPLHRLGSDQWSKARRRAAEQARDTAAELLDVYARRAARGGYAFPIDTAEYGAFAAGFPFEATEDQQSAIDGVIADLKCGQPMDRVVCGDVGFGKTEVALRAAFVSVQAGKQVALLVPTTLLAQQHFQTFEDRFADWPVRVEMLSRFRSGRQQTSVLEELAAGQVDIVIGTHALLRKKVKFKSLGIAIIDEEHRFGVRDKERLKSLRAEVDVLTLTATPIPRTLNLALAGLRDLSIIATPPAERLAVKTFVSQWNKSLIYEACLREIKRGGQVYFVHNSVESIDRVAAEVAALVPEAEVRVAHGQMRERDLEQVMLDFYHRRFNVLVCTTIIESGIDVPTANTIVINRADKFGLAQLHQLRGRVGRSHHRAYAYLLAPPKKSMTADAAKRLEAIESLEELGAGFTLATHDLEIRGAGEILGAEQSGQIHEVGFSLYSELLERAVEALKSGHSPDLERPLEHGPEIDLKLAALLPADYMPDVHMRLILYKRIASAASEEELNELQVEMIDRFGLLPEPAKSLFRLALLKLKAAPLGVQRIEAGAQSGRIIFNAEPQIDPQAVIRLVQNQPRTYQLDGADKLRFNMDMPDREARIRAVGGLLERLGTRAAA